LNERVDGQLVHKRARESLVKCGALAGLGAPRRGMHLCLEEALAWVQKLQDDQLRGQGSIFDLGEPSDDKPRHHPAIPPGEYEKGELLKLEKETLGLYVSEHPLAAMREQLRRRSDCTL